MKKSLRLCVALAVMLLGSLPLLAQAPTVSVSANSNPVCAGSLVFFDARVSNEPEYLFTLTNGAGSTQSGATKGGVTRLSISLIASGSGSQTFTLTITAPGGTASATTNLTVKPQPNASFTGLAGPYCADAAAVTLTPTMAGGTFSGPGVSGNTFTPTNAKSGGSITYSVVADGCTNTSSQNVTVKPLPNASFTGLASAYCADAAAVTLTPTTAGGTFTGPGVSGTTFTPAGTGGTVTYTIPVEGCPNSSTSQNVSVKPVPNASFTGLAGPYCADAAEVTLSPTTAGGTFSGSGVSGNTFTPANAGSGSTILYSITVDGCTSSTSQNVSVNALPIVTPGPNQSVILGFGSNCTDISATATGAPTLGYSWNKGAGNTATVNVCPQITTTYTVTVSDGNTCQATAQVTVNVQDVRCGPGKKNVQICYYGVSQCVSEKVAKNYLKLGATLGACGSNPTARTSYEPTAGERVLSLSVRAYPNPTTGRVVVEVQSPVAGVSRFEVLNAGGQAVQQKDQPLTEGLNEVPFELVGRPAGNYLIRCVDVLGRQAVVRVNRQ